MRAYRALSVALSVALMVCFSSHIAFSYNPEVYQAQKALKDLGYDPGPVDGVWGKATERAIKYFQVDTGLSVTGELDGQTKEKLGIGSSDRGIKAKSKPKKRRLALVIGNGDYQNSPLKNPVNDAQDMARVLRKMGFEVIHKENAEQRRMEEAIRDFGRGLRSEGIGLFYFAGHGIQVKGRNYLIPIGAKIESESDVRFESVDAGRVLGKMEDAGNELNIVILDACRNNPFARSFRSSNRGLARMDAPKGSLVAYATAPGSVASDGKGRNGTYTKYLLKHMGTPGLKVEEVLKNIRIDVMEETGDKQVPWESSSLRGDFYFNTGKASVTAAVKGDAGLEEERQRLEAERQELERIKAEIERKKLEVERKRLEEERQKLELAKLPSAPSLKEIARDGEYVAYASGIVRDTRTGLEWVAGPEMNTIGKKAKAWVENLNIDGGGWRMPTIKELRSLFRKGKGSRNMTPLLKTTGWYVWSGDTKGGTTLAWFSFRSGKWFWSENYLQLSGKGRAFAVRSSKVEKQGLETPPIKSQLDAIMRNGYIRVASDATYAPFAMVTKKGEFIGFDMDIAREMARELGVKHKRVNIPFAELIPLLQRDYCDIVISGMEMKEELSEKVDVTKPYIIIDDKPCVWIIKKGDSRFLAWLNQFLIKIKKTGILEKLYSKYFVESDWSHFHGSKPDIKTSRIP